MTASLRYDNDRNLESSLMFWTTSSTSKSNCTAKDGKRHYVTAKDAYCLDGSKPVYYVRKGYGEGATKWNLFFEGGGWCYNLSSCMKRATTHVGTSKHYAKCLRFKEMNFYQSGNQLNNPLMYNWNTVHIKYCDSSSYAGDAIVEYQGKTLYFTGKRNREAFIHDLLNNGMSSATDVVISGCSAGGLGIYLGIDSIRDQILARNASIKLRGLIDSGYFPDLTSNDKFLRRRHTAPDEAIVDGIMDYANAMRNVFAFSNMSAGAHPECVSKMSQPKSKTSSDPNHHRLTNCVFARYNAPHITTPVFIIQPQYDQWQIWHIFGNPFDNSFINMIGEQIVTNITRYVLTKPQNGAFFDACTHHCTSCSNQPEDIWNGKHVRSSRRRDGVDSGLTPAQAFAIWYFDEWIENHVKETVNMKNGLSDQTFTKQMHIHIQAHTYPCHDCCICHA